MDADGFIQTRDLTKVYSFGSVEVVALRNATLSVGRGRFVGVTGTSGSGKSTLMNLLGGLDTPSSGSIRVEGKPVSDLSKSELALFRRHTIGMIFQSFNLVASYTAQENVAFPLLFAGVAKKERNRRAAELLRTVGLAERGDHRPVANVGRRAAARRHCPAPGEPTGDSAGG